MDTKENKMYEAPSTVRTQVRLESGICAASTDKVVIDDKNADVTIDRQTDGGSFQFNDWDETPGN